MNDRENECVGECRKVPEEAEVFSVDNFAIEKIKKGTALKADVAQQPRDIGAKTIEAIARHFKGEPTEAKIAVPVKIVDANSAK